MWRRKREVKRLNDRKSRRMTIEGKRRKEERVKRMRRGEGRGESEVGTGEKE